MKFRFLSFTFLLVSLFVIGQDKGTVIGHVLSKGEPVPFAGVVLKNTNTGTSTDENGNFSINLPEGKQTLVVQMIGYKTQEKTINVPKNGKVHLDFNLEEEMSSLDQIVVTGTKTFKRKTNSPVIVNVTDSKTLGNLQVCNLSEGLKFQPGLRVDTDCQTCNYTQLRMNGLQGGYSQILINGRPIFSPLMGLYGMEQLPVNMIDRIEVVRGGGSSLYGSSAIGGTVNVLTKLPKNNGYEINSFFQSVEGRANDFNLNGNATFVSKDGKTGTTFFLTKRIRDMYDANGDNFSELPEMDNTSFGINSFYLFTDNQKLEFSLSNLNEYRYGGEMVEKPAYLTKQSEERTHKIWMGNIDYQINFNEDKSTFITYAAFQHTNRDHYTGIFPDEADDIQSHIENPPYGVSTNTTLQGGFQFNHQLDNFFNTKNVLTIGSEYISDKVLDEIPSYNYLVDQHTKNFGTFFQSDWDITKNLNLLSGVRLDSHNFLDKLILNPRLALLYKFKGTTQFRLSYGTGFRAPQAFDTDLHIAFAGGGISRVQLSPNLKEECSQSFSASVNFDKSMSNKIFGFTLEGFYTHLKDAFVLENIGEDEFGEVFLKSNGQGAAVKGATLELRTNINKKLQLETGFTLQKSEFENPVSYIDGKEAVKTFLRTPDDYGYANLSIMPNNKWNININYIYTGKMKIAHFGGAENFPEGSDAFLQTKSFSEINTKVAYKFHVHKFESDLEIYGGVKNVFNAYQNDFDLGKNRDSSYIYGPSMPRTVFVGLKISSNTH